MQKGFLKKIRFWKLKSSDLLDETPPVFRRISLFFHSVSNVSWVWTLVASVGEDTCANFLVDTNAAIVSDVIDISSWIICQVNWFLYDLKYSSIPNGHLTYFRLSFFLFRRYPIVYLSALFCHIFQVISGQFWMERMWCARSSSLCFPSTLTFPRVHSCECECIHEVSSFLSLSISFPLLPVKLRSLSWSAIPWWWRHSKLSSFRTTF